MSHQHLLEPFFFYIYKLHICYTLVFMDIFIPFLSREDRRVSRLALGNVSRLATFVAARGSQSHRRGWLAADVEMWYFSHQHVVIYLFPMWDFCWIFIHQIPLMKGGLSNN